MSKSKDQGNVWRPGTQFKKTAPGSGHADDLHHTENERVGTELEQISIMLSYYFSQNSMFFLGNMNSPPSEPSYSFGGKLELGPDRLKAKKKKIKKKIRSRCPNT